MAALGAGLEGIVRPMGAGVGGVVERFPWLPVHAPAAAAVAAPFQPSLH